MRPNLEIFVAEVRRSWLFFRRYPLQTVLGMAMTTSLFLALVLGARYVAGPMAALGDRLDEVIVGYVLWNMLIFAMGEISIGLQGEADTGTLEQVFLSVVPVSRVFLLRAIANQLLILFLNSLSLGTILLVTGRRLSWSSGIVLPLLFLLCGCYGLGFLLGSATLLYKRIGPLLSFAQFGVMALVVVPLESLRLGAGVLALPLVPGAIVLRSVLARGESLDPGLTAWAAVNGFVYLGIGLLVFRWCQSRVRNLGTLGSY